jgi:hypothetical protein
LSGTDCCSFTHQAQKSLFEFELSPDLIVTDNGLASLLLLQGEISVKKGGRCNELNTGLAGYFRSAPDGDVESGF